MPIKEVKSHFTLFKKATQSSEERERNQCLISSLMQAFQWFKLLILAVSEFVQRK